MKKRKDSQLILLIQTNAVFWVAIIAAPSQDLTIPRSESPKLIIAIKVRAPIPNDREIIAVSR